MKRTWTAAAAGLLILLAPLARATVSCSVSATGPNFGIYSPLSATPTAATGSLAVTCTLLSGGTTSVPMTVYLTSGSSGTFTPRTMLNGTNTLNYNLYWSTQYTQIWGDGTGGSYYGTATVTVSTLGRTATATGTMYGEIPAGQDVAPGTYLDTITVTVSY